MTVSVRYKVYLRIRYKSRKSKSKSTRGKDRVCSLPPAPHSRESTLYTILSALHLDTREHGAEGVVSIDESPETGRGGSRLDSHAALSSRPEAEARERRLEPARHSHISVSEFQAFPRFYSPPLYRIRHAVLYPHFTYITQK